jgi:hypothetical protein
MAMLRQERRQILQNNHINNRDIFIFRWRISQVLCEAPRKWGGLTDVELLIRAYLLGYQNNELEQDFLKGKPHNVYTAIIEEVMTDLVNRHIARKEEEKIPYGDREMSRYTSGPALNELGCRGVTRIGLGDPETYNRLFPVKIGTG